ncbi:MAG: glycosyltransferase family 39 protein [Cyanobacteria bacterium P01_D01_bin.44]
MLETNIPLQKTSTDRQITLRTRWLLVLLFIITVISRIIFAAEIVHPGDAGNFTLAVEHFDVRLEQPQMPGMFILFILFARAFNLFLGDPHASLIAVNILASAIAVVMLFIIGREWFNAKVGWTASLLMMTSPALWHRSEVALSHVTEFGWVLLIDFAAYRTGLGQRQALLLLGFLMGLAGGIRPSTPFFLLPFALFAVYRGLRTRGFRLRDVGLAFLVGFAGIAIWLIPLIQFSGGWNTYWQLVQAWLPLHTQRQDADSLVKVLDNFLQFSKALLRIVGIALLPMLWMIFRQKVSWIRRAWPRRWPAQSLVLSVLPGCLYFLLVHLRRKDQTFTVMPGFILMASCCVVALGERLQSRYRYALAWVVGITVGLNGLYFLLGPDGLPTARALRNYDLEFTPSIEYIRETFPPETTVVMTHPYYFRLSDIYFPDYQAPQLSSNIRDEPMPLAPPIRNFVLLGDRVFRKPGQDDGFQREVVSEQGIVVRSLTWTEDQMLWVTRRSAELRPAQE